MPLDEASLEAEAEAADHLDAILDDDHPASIGERIERFASSGVPERLPELVARVLIGPIRSGRCEHLPARFWFITADVFYRATRHADCRAALGRAFIAAGDADMDDSAKGYFTLGLLEAAAHQWGRAVSAWEACLAILPSGSTLEPTALRLLGEGWEALGVPDRASARFIEALKLTARRGDVATECGLLFQLGRHSADRGWIDQATFYLNLALERAREEGYPAGEAAAEIGRTSVCLELGEVENARRAIDLGLTKAREVGDRLLQANALEHLAEVHRRTGNVDDARGALEEAIFLAKGANAHAMLASLYHMMAMLHETAGKKPLAITAYENALRERRRAGDSAGLGATLNNLASLHLERGDVEAARGFYREAIVAFNECGHERKEIQVVLENLKRIEPGRPEEEDLEPAGGDLPYGRRDVPSPEAGTEPDQEDDAGAPPPRTLRPPIPFPGRRTDSAE